MFFSYRYESRSTFHAAWFCELNPLELDVALRTRFPVTVGTAVVAGDST